MKNSQQPRQIFYKQQKKTKLRDFYFSYYLFRKPQWG